MLGHGYEFGRQAIRVPATTFSEALLILAYQDFQYGMLVEEEYALEMEATLNYNSWFSGTVGNGA